MDYHPHSYHHLRFRITYSPRKNNEKAYIYHQRETYSFLEIRELERTLTTQVQSELHICSAPERMVDEYIQMVTRKIPAHDCIVVDYAS